jgi:hypothetical protein
MVVITLSFWSCFAPDFAILCYKFHILERVSAPNLRVQFSGLDALTPWERRDARNARYFAPGVSLHRMGPTTIEEFIGLLCLFDWKPMRHHHFWMEVPAHEVF